jgi:hypothetical protein
MDLATGLSIGGLTVGVVGLYFKERSVRAAEQRERAAKEFLERERIAKVESRVLAAEKDIQAIREAAVRRQADDERHIKLVVLETIQHNTKG